MKRFVQMLSLFVVFAAAAIAQTAMESMAAGTANFKKGQYAAAVADFSRAIAADPKNADAYAFRGASYAFGGDSAKALPDLEQAIALKTRVGVAYTLRGLLKGNPSNDAATLADFNQALSMDSTDAMARIGRATVYYSQKEFAKALADLKLANAEQVPVALAIRGKSYAQVGDYENAIKDLTASEKAASGDPELFYLRGLSYLNRNELSLASTRQAMGALSGAQTASPNVTQAISDLSTAIRLNPKYEAAYLQRGVAYRAAYDNAKAMADFAQVLTLNPKNADAYIERSAAYPATDKPKQMADLDQAVAIAPTNSRGYYRRAMATDKNNAAGRQKAIADLNLAIKHDPKYIDALRTRGGLYADEKKYDLAIADMSEIVKLRPDDNLSYSSRAIIYCSAGKKDLAALDFIKAESIISRKPAGPQRSSQLSSLELMKGLCI